MNTEALEVRKNNRNISTIEIIFGNNPTLEPDEYLKTLERAIIERVLPSFLDLFPQVQVMGAPVGLIEYKRKIYTIRAKSENFSFDLLTGATSDRRIDPSTFQRGEIVTKTREENLIEVLTDALTNSIQSTLDKGLWYIAYVPLDLRKTSVGIQSVTRYATFNPKEPA